MTFTFDNTLSTDLALVRFHIGDTHSDGYYLADETINYLVTTHGVTGAVVRGIDYIITQLSQPDFKLDWMSVSNEKAREGYERLKKEKEQELGISSGAIATATIVHPHRADSYENDDEVYTAPDGAP
jgi:cysteine synthase